MLNPYESPQTVEDAIERAWRLPADMGQLVGTYFQALALLSVVSMLAQSVLSGAIFIDFSFVLLCWAGVYLKRHSPVARTCSLVLSWLFVSACVLFLLIAVTFGTQSMTVWLGFNRIHDPSILQVMGVASVGVLRSLSSQLEWRSRTVCGGFGDFIRSASACPGESRVRPPGRNAYSSSREQGGVGTMRSGWILVTRNGNAEHGWNSVPGNDRNLTQSWRIVRMGLMECSIKGRNRGTVLAA